MCWFGLLLSSYGEWYVCNTLYTCARAHTHAHTHTRARARPCVCTTKHIRTRTHTYTHTHTHTHTHKHSHTHTHRTCTHMQVLLHTLLQFFSSSAQLVLVHPAQRELVPMGDPPLALDAVADAKCFTVVADMLGIHFEILYSAHQ